MSRRVWIRLASAAAAGALLLGPSAAKGLSASLEKELVIVDTGGAFQRALKEQFHDAFSKVTGVTVRLVAASNAEQWTKVKAMSAARAVEWDIVSAGENDLVTQREVLARLDCDALPNAGAQGVPGTCQEYGLLRTIGGSIIAYNARTFPPGRQPRGWEDFWDVQRFPGPRALPNAGFPWEVLAAALLADGVPPDTLFPMDLDRAFRKLDQLKPHVKVWWRSGDQSQQVFRDDEVVMAMMWSGRALSLKAAGVPVEVEWRQGIKGLAYWAVLKDAPHPKAARAFLNFFMDRPEAHLAFARQMFYDTSNRKALELLPKPARRSSASFDANWGSMIGVVGNPWVIENRDRLLERWNAWLAK